MKVLSQKSDGTYDIYMDVSTNQLAMSYDKEAYANIIEDSLRTLEGELQLDTEGGIPYLRTVFESLDKIPIWMFYVRKRVMSFDFVKDIVQFTYSVDPQTKVLTCDLKVDTDDGEISLGVNYTGEISGGGEDMSGLIQDGLFYLPVHKTDGVQFYRILTDLVNEEMGVTTRISEQLFIKVDGLFVEYTA